MGIVKFAAPSSGGWLVQLISWLVGISGAVWLGVILFTLILKLVTLPFDYVSRASMRKNSLKMEEMRPELEKLQRQYADNKQLYNQKMMALYKKNGYSMFGACLPTILTLVIFIIAINAFTDYSKFQNKTYFYNMSNSYNNVVYAGFDINENEEYIYRDKNGKLIVKGEDIIGEANPSEEKSDVISLRSKKGYDFDLFYSVSSDLNNEQYYKLTVWTTYSYVEYSCFYLIKEEGLDWKDPSFKPRVEGLMISTAENAPVKDAPVLASAENNNLKVKVDGVNKTFAELNALDSSIWTAENFILDIRQTMSAKTYKNEQQSFLWVKNIWVTDSPMQHPIESSWSNFKNTHSYHGADIREDYGNLIEKLDKEKTEPNGYFILIALTALSSLVLQIVSTKAAKAQMELQTVDGQGMQQQKMMQWIMPIMMAVFAFMYTAAFSLYIIVNSLLSMVMTFGINFIVDSKFKKEQRKQKPKAIRGRVYTPKAEEKPEKKEKKNKSDKFAHESGGDFLTGKVKNKRK